MNIQMATSEIPSVLRGGRVGSSGYSQGRTPSRVGGGRGRGELCIYYVFNVKFSLISLVSYCIFMIVYL